MVVHLFESLGQMFWPLFFAEACIHVCRNDQTVYVLEYLPVLYMGNVGQKVLQIVDEQM